MREDGGDSSVQEGVKGERGEERRVVNKIQGGMAKEG